MSSRLRTLLRQKVREAGSMRAFARANGLSVSQVSLVLAGKSRAGPKTLTALGLTERRIYTRQNGADV